MNRDKLRLREKEVSYLAHKMTSEGLQADDKKILAILTNMPNPTDKKGVKRTLGMTNYLQRFAPHLSEVNAPFQELLKGVQFVWEEQIHGACMNKVKQIISQAPVLKYFD